MVEGERIAVRNRRAGSLPAAGAVRGAGDVT